MEHDVIDDAKAAAERGDFQSAVVLLRPLADAGNREAQYQLALLAMGQCDLISGREAFSLLRAAAEQGHIDAMFQLAKLPNFSRTERFQSPLSLAEEWSWLLRAAEAGCVEAQYDVGASLATGEWGDGGVIERDWASAVAWYRRASEAGHPIAQFNLATMLLRGEGCEPDVDAARGWLKRSMAAGFTPARELLATLESSGDEDR